MKRLIALLLALVLALGMIACGAQEETAPTTDPTEPTKEPAQVAESDDVQYLKLSWENINSTKSGFKTCIDMGNYLDTNLIWNTLIRWDVETGEIVYELANDITVSDDGLTYTVTLADAFWHDGTPVTAADVVFTYHAVVLGATTGFRSSFTNIKGIDAAINGETDVIEGIYAKDDKTVIFELTEPNALYLSISGSIFSAGWASIMPAHILGDTPYLELATHTYWSHPIGTGPFMVEEVSYPNYCVLTRNENYFKTPAKIEKVLLTSYTDMEAQIAAAMAGECYSMRSIAKSAAEDAIAQNSDLAYYEHASAFTRALDLMYQDGVTQYPDLQKAKVRQALNIIIDKQAIADYVGSATPATNFNNDLEYNSDIPLWERNVELGIQMLEEADFDFSQTLTILAYYTDQTTVDVLDIIVANLAEAGVNADYTIDAQTPNESFATGAYAAMYAGIGYNTAVYERMSTNGTYGKRILSIDPDRPAEYDALFAAYKTTADAAGRKTIAGELQLMYLEDMYFFPIYFINTGYMVNSGKLQGWTGISADYETQGFYDICNWTLVD